MSNTSTYMHNYYMVWSGARNKYEFVLLDPHCCMSAMQCAYAFHPRVQMPLWIQVANLMEPNARRFADIVTFKNMHAIIYIVCDVWPLGVSKGLVFNQIYNSDNLSQLLISWLIMFNKKNHLPNSVLKWVYGLLYYFFDFIHLVFFETYL